MIEPTRWRDNPRAPDGAAMFHYLEPPPPMPAELRRATVPRVVEPSRRAPWIALGLAAIVVAGLALAAVVVVDGAEPQGELVDVRQLEPARAPQTGGMQVDSVQVGSMHEALTPMNDESPPPIVEEEREPKPRPRTTSMSPAVTLGQPANRGYLHVNSMPWAEVIVDGRRVGNTPVVRLALAPGAHVVTLLAPSTGTRRTHRVQIRGGETTRLLVQLDAPTSDPTLEPPY